MRGQSRDMAEPWRTKMVATSGQNKFAGKPKQALVRRQDGQVMRWDKLRESVAKQEGWRSRKEHFFSQVSAKEVYFNCSLGSKHNLCCDV